ncbi:CPBP family intramembrane glutamic endopeptidase [Halopelagius fulvigenes]|uniref:CPBP family intramembrane glutamic endopeptidase n=1 Tax=Halopelagius fulvigenes TaxID=1198324 RepID=A0ABD5U4F4_9EURY
MTMQAPTDASAGSVGPDAGGGSYLRRAGALLGLGLVGVASLGATVALTGALPDVPGFSTLAVLLLTLVAPTAFLIVAVLLGTRAAPCVGLRSLVADRATDGTPVLPELGDIAPYAVGAGAAVGLLLASLDVVFAPLGATPAVEGRPTFLQVFASVPVRFLYGGITEELILRWGVLSAVAWVGWRATGGVRRPGPTVMWPAIGITALLFGLGHLPAVAGIGTLTPSVVARTVLLNALGGVVYGWFAWRYHLEAAMLAHAGTHVVFVTLSLLVVVLS